MAGANSSGEVNYWPAFVDVLTTVIMVVTFLLVIMSAAVMTLSKNFVTKMIYEKQGSTAADTFARTDMNAPIPTYGSSGPFVAPAPDAALKSKAVQAGGDSVIALARSIQNSPKLSVSAPSDETSPESGGSVVRSASALATIDFEPTALKLSDDASAQLAKILAAAPEAKGAKLEIWSIAPSFGSVSVAERQAYYRALYVRSALLKDGYSAADVSARLRVGEDPSATHQVIIIAKP